MAYYPAGGKTYFLGSSISSTATSILLSSFTVPVSGDDLTMALMNTAIAYGTIAPGTSSSEFISFTGITQNADGTATLTGVTRGLNKTYPFTESSDFKLPHAGQSVFILSDAPQVFNKYAALDNANTFTAVNNFDTPPTIDADPVNGEDAARRSWVLSVVNGGAVSQNAVTEDGIAGETIAAGNLIYFSETENEWMKCDADTLGTVISVKLGIAMGAGVNGGAISGGVLMYGDYTTSGLTQGDLVYASNTAGGFNSGTPGTTPRVIGAAKSSTVLYFDPYFQDFLYNYGVDAVGTDSYAITLPGAFSAYYAGMLVAFKAGTANTGACTLAINGGSAKTIKKNVSSDMETGDILQNQIVLVQYDGTNFQVISNPASNASTTVKGVVEEATQAEADAGTAAGGTGARLFLSPSVNRNKVFISTTEVTFTDGNGGAGAGNEQTLFSTTIPGGLLSTNNGVHIKMWLSGINMGQAANAYTFRIKYGGATQITLANESSAGDLVAMTGWVESYILADGATNAQKISAEFTFMETDGESNTDAAVTMDKSHAGVIASGAINSTTDQTLVITLQQTNSAANDCVVEWCIVESIR